MEGISKETAKLEEAQRRFGAVVNDQHLGILSKYDLPSPDCRWTPKRKATLAVLITAGIVSLEDMAKRYSLSAEEVANVIAMRQKYGDSGLRVTRLQMYRPGKAHL